MGRRQDHAEQEERLRSQPVTLDTGRGRPSAAADAGVDDLEKYLVHLAHLDMPLPVKIELIQAVGAIMQSFVDRAFGDPTQLAVPDADRSDVKDASRVAPVVSSQLEQIPNNQTGLSGAFLSHGKRLGGESDST